MASKRDLLQAEFLLANATTGVKAKDWCDSKDLNYNSARRYIKLTAAKPSDKTKAASNPVVKTIKAKTNKVGPPFGSQNAKKHGGYSKYFKSEIGELVEVTTLPDELDLARSRIHDVIGVITDIHIEIEASQKPETTANLYKTLLMAELAFDRSMARVESLSKTISSIDIDKLQQGKIIADTKRSAEMTKAAIVATRKNEVQTELAQLQVTQARKDAGGTSKVDNYIDMRTNSPDTVVG